MASGLTLRDDHVGMARGFRCSLGWNSLKRENSSGEEAIAEETVAEETVAERLRSASTTHTDMPC